VPPVVSGRLLPPCPRGRVWLDALERCLAMRRAHGLRGRRALIDGGLFLCSARRAREPIASVATQIATELGSTGGGRKRTESAPALKKC
jgi:hypothetical protein